MTTYRLHDCAGLLPDIYTNSTLTPTIDTYSGKFIYTQQYPDTCWEVIKDSAPTPETLGVLLSFDICQDCLDALASQCGCPPGYTYNTSSQLCESSTPVCPEGYTYNAASGLCVGAPANCKMDLTLVVDASSSISQTELDNLKAFLVTLVDDINGTNGEDRIVSGDVQIGIVRFNNALELTGGQNILDLSGGSTAWASGSAGGSIKQAISNFVVYSSGSTNTVSGLSVGYDNITGPNNRNSDPTVARRILFITDGFPSWAYSGTYNGTVVPNTTLGGINCTNSNYQLYRCQAYNGAMDLAQTIKSGSAGTPVACDITLMIVGETTGTGTLEYYATRDSLVGNTGGTSGVTNPAWSTTPCSLNTSGIFTPCVNWSCTYTSTDRFCSNNIAGDPDYFMSLFDATSLAAVKDGIVQSLLCPNTETPTACSSPCVLNTTTGECECSTSNYTTCCYDLINCKDGSLYATVNTNNLGFDYLAAYVGSIIVFEGLEECLFVTVSSNCANSTPIGIVTITDSFTTCQECQEAIQINPCYKLTNCNNGEVFIMTQQNLNAYAGLVVELAEYPGLCWTILETYNCVGEFTTVSIVQSYPDCECCFQYQCV